MKTTMDNVPYVVLDKWWLALIEDGRFLCAQESRPIFPLDHDGIATPEDRFHVIIEWHENGIKKRMETCAGDIGTAMANMWRRWIASGMKLW